MCVLLNLFCRVVTTFIGLWCIFRTVPSQPASCHPKGLQWPPGAAVHQPHPALRPVTPLDPQAQRPHPWSSKMVGGWGEKKLPVWFQWVLVVIILTCFSSCSVNSLNLFTLVSHEGFEWTNNVLVSGTMVTNIRGVSDNPKPHNKTHFYQCCSLLSSSHLQPSALQTQHCFSKSRERFLS